jgi:FtsP/CotA-like multicopper oxidase with cupredoxin domain
MKPKDVNEKSLWAQDSPQQVTRRTFLGLAATTIASLATSCLPVAGQIPEIEPTSGNGTVTPTPPRIPLVASNRFPLRMPPDASPTNYELEAAPGTADLGGGRSSSVLAYNGSVPGPTFRAKKGDSVSIPFKNGLFAQTSVHWHGLVVPPAADGQPQDAIAPGSAYSYQFSINQRAALNFYHPHPHMRTGEQVELGLAGAFIVNDDEEAALGLPSGAYEVPLVVRDANFDAAGNFVYNPTYEGFYGDTPIVNGTREPYLDVDSAVYRFRVLNGGNARIFRLALDSGADFTLIGNDGGLLETAIPIKEIEIGSGERLDLLIDFRGLPPGGVLMLRDLNADWDLLEFRGTGVEGGGTIPTGTLSSIEKLSDPVTTREFTFDKLGQINGIMYSMDRIDFEVPFGQTELWRFTAQGTTPHPVHTHGASFQVQSRSGGRGQVFPWEQGWKDTVLIIDGETTDVLVRFDGYRGRYLLHCHNLEHEDHGMMLNFEVV